MTHVGYSGTILIPQSPRGGGGGQDPVNENSPDLEILFFHCIICWEVLYRTFLNMSSDINTAIKLVNFIHSRDFNYGQFISLLGDVG
jgi:hypothetical protein